ncbi:hypothetical protein KY285_010642 [Solanum tuberosum]|nr:hypothetical protein KY289_011192 [Solanum tuberosum]KAH0734935.1 hypothetical protein KY285_010642 [Solanum tuberosum]
MQTPKSRNKNGNKVLETHYDFDHLITYDSDSDDSRAQGGCLRWVLNSLELPHPEVKLLQGKISKKVGRMIQSAILKKKGSNPNKAQSQLKNLDFDMQYRSSAELANKFKNKREQLANERIDRVKKEQAPIPHKRENSEDFIPHQGKSKLLGHKSVIQSSSREELRTSHTIAGKGQTKQRLFQSGESIEEKGIKLPMNNSRFQTSFKVGVTASVHVTGTTLGNGEVQHDIEDLLNFKQVKRKSVLPSTSIDQFLDKQRIHNEHDIHDVPNCKQVKRKSVIPANRLY